MATGSGLKGVWGEMARDTNTRTADKQQQLEKHYEQRLKVLRLDLQEAMEEGEDQTTDDRNICLGNLSELIKEKIYIEKQILEHTAQLGQAYEDMKMELRTVIMGKIEDYKEAQEMLEGAAQTDDEGDANGDTGIRNDHDTGKGRKHGNAQSGSPSADDKQRPKKKVRKGIITDVPGKEQVRRAEVMAKQGRQV